MPIISRFYGIVIRMYFQQAEHNPQHIHAIYGDHVASIIIETGQILEGNLPKQAYKLVRKWVTENRDVLLHMWNTQEFKPLTPLE